MVPLLRGPLKSSFIPSAPPLKTGLDPNDELKVITPEFSSACNPDVSFDGRRILFAGKKEPAGPFNIFGLVLDGPERVDRNLDNALDWDTMCGVSRRAWARNTNPISTIDEWDDRSGARGHITKPRLAEEAFLKNLIDG